MQFTHRHADGGFYKFEEPQSGKHPETGEWVEGVAYRGDDGGLRWTDNQRWADRFEELPPSRFQDQQTVEVKDEEGVIVASFTFHIEEASDVRHMLVRAAEHKGGKSDDHHWMKMVLLAQADMVSKGLHIREHDFPDLIGDVAAFHAKFGQEYTGKPRILPEDLHDFRVKFHEEETHEYRDEYPKLRGAVVEKDRRDILHSLETQLDSLCDAVWVVLGTADLQFGRRIFYAAWRRVVEANMAKVKVEVKDDGDRNCAETGRAAKYDIGKPAGWLPPDHSDLLGDNAIFDELFGPVPEAIEHVPTAQEV